MPLPVCQRTREKMTRCWSIFLTVMKTLAINSLTSFTYNNDANITKKAFEIRETRPKNPTTTWNVAITVTYWKSSIGYWSVSATGQGSRKIKKLNREKMGPTLVLLLLRLTQKSASLLLSWLFSDPIRPGSKLAGLLLDTHSIDFSFLFLAIDGIFISLFSNHPR